MNRRTHQQNRWPILLILALAASLCAASADAQQQLTEHTLGIEAEAVAGSAKLDVMAFLKGTWRAEALGGVVEESWLAEADGAMLGMFRLTQAGKPTFYELMTMNQVGDSLQLKVKHFSPQLQGWEEKDDSVTFRLVKVEQGRIYFNGLTFVPSEDEVTIYLAMRMRDGSYREEEFRMSRPK